MNNETTKEKVFWIMIGGFLSGINLGVLPFSFNPFTLIIGVGIGIHTIYRYSQFEE